MKALPTLLTLFRVALIPVVIGLLLWPIPAAQWAAAGVFALAAFTDFLDGWLARKLDAVTAFGRFLDPIADKLIVAAVLIALTAQGRLGPYGEIAAMLIVFREILVSGLREFLAEHAIAMPVSRLAKWKTALQLVALPLLIVGAELPDGGHDIAIGVLWIATLLTVVTGLDYLSAGLAHMRRIDRKDETQDPG